MDFRIKCSRQAIPIAIKHAVLIAGYCSLPDLLCPHTVYSVPTHTWFQSTPLGDHGRCRRVPRGFLSQFPSVQFMYICRDHIYIGHRVSLGRTQVYLPRSEPHSGATLSGRTPEPQSSSNTCALQGAQSIRSRKCISGCYIFGYYPLRTDSAAFTMLSHAFLM